MRKKIIFSYDGSKFNGLQRQKNTRTVQKTIEEALSKIFEDDIELKASGRTDAGVHAVSQVAHFDIKKDIKGLKHKLNLLLNPDINKLSNIFNACVLLSFALTPDPIPSLIAIKYFPSFNLIFKTLSPETSHLLLLAFAIPIPIANLSSDIKFNILCFFIY